MRAIPERFNLGDLGLIGFEFEPDEYIEAVARHWLTPAEDAAIEAAREAVMGQSMALANEYVNLTWSLMVRGGRLRVGAALVDATQADALPMGLKVGLCVMLLWQYHVYGLAAQLRAAAEYPAPAAEEGEAGADANPTPGPPANTAGS